MGGDQVEGRQAVRELLLAGTRRVREIWMENDGGDASILRDIRELAEANRIPLNVVGRGRFSAQARSEAPQGVLALAAPLPEADLDELIAGHRLANDNAPRTADRDAKIKAKAFQTQLKAIKKWGRSAPDDLSKITQPTLIANGDNDRMVPSVLSEDLHRRVKGSELIIYADSGHGGIFQFHDKFAPAAIEFLDR